MQIFILTAYLLTFPLVWFADRYIVCDRFRRPIWFSHRAQAIYFMLRMAFTYGTFGIIWALYDWRHVLGAFAVYYLFTTITFRYYFNREIAYCMKGYLEAVADDDKAIPHEPDQIMEAYQFARRTVIGNMRGVYGS